MSARCSVGDCRRKPQAHSRLCSAHFAALCDRVIRGKA